MQDIPRHELLDKLAAGWKVRRKNWGTATEPISRKSDCNIKLWQYLECDWEGEPPEPTRILTGCSIVIAFERLFNGAAFIRRTAWRDKQKRYTQGTFSISLQIEELLAHDWEVWGYE